MAGLGVYVVCVHVLDEGKPIVEVSKVVEDDPENDLGVVLCGSCSDRKAVRAEEVRFLDAEGFAALKAARGFVQ